MPAATSTLDTIRTKVRRLTRSPSTAQLSDNDLDQYINTFIENDIPTTVKLFSLRTLLTWYTQPFIDTYETNTAVTTDPLYNFKNKYTAVHNPVYMAGVPSYYTQDRGIFYNNWPQTNAVQNTGLVGNGTAGPFVGIINTFNPVPLTVSARQFILQKSVMFSAFNANGDAMILIDTPINSQTGVLGVPGLPPVNGTINYITGAFSVIFQAPTALSTTLIPNPIISTYIPYLAGKPVTMLFYDEKFIIRPVPDKAYIVNIEVNIRPTELLSIGDVPQITQWWMWIAYGASRFIFQDRMDVDSVDMITPEFERQQALALSTSMEQYTEQRSITPFTNNGVNQVWNNGWGRGPY